MKSVPVGIVIQADTLEQQRSGSITGVLFWKVNGQCFPDDAWNDFALATLCWWTSAVVRLVDGDAERERMDFMDGPYSIDCHMTGISVECRFVERRSEERLVLSCTTELRDLARSILSATATCIDSCHHNKWTGADLDSLVSAAGELKNRL